MTYGLALTLYPSHPRNFSMLVFYLLRSSLHLVHSLTTNHVRDNVQCISDVDVATPQQEVDPIHERKKRNG